MNATVKLDYDFFLGLFAGATCEDIAATVGDCLFAAIADDERRVQKILRRLVAEADDTECFELLLQYAKEGKKP